MQLGYCCINQTLRGQKPSIYTNRTLMRKTFTLEKADEFALQNVNDLETILQWNESHGIKAFRISSELFPRMTDKVNGYSFDQLKNTSQIEEKLAQIGEWAYNHNHLLSMHPGPYTCIASDTEETVANSIQELEMHGWIADKLTKKAPVVCNINWHIGRSKGNGILDKFISNWSKTSDSVKKRTCIENDDKKNGWTVVDLMPLAKEGIKITLDLHHSLFCKSGLSLQEEFELVRPTWNGGWQEIHYSESAELDKQVPAHSEYYRFKLPSFLENTKTYVHLECKQKELALLKYREEFYK